MRHKNVCLCEHLYMSLSPSHLENEKRCNGDLPGQLTRETSLSPMNMNMNPTSFCKLQAIAGSSSVLLPGCRLERGSVLLPCSVVAPGCKMPEGQMCAQIPATPIQQVEPDTCTVPCLIQARLQKTHLLGMNELLLDPFWRIE